MGLNQHGTLILFRKRNRNEKNGEIKKTTQVQEAFLTPEDMVRVAGMCSVILLSRSQF